MKIKQKKNGRGSKGFKKGGPPGPGRPKTVDKLSPITTFLSEELSRDIPLTLIERLSENLASRDPKVFLDSFKAVLNLLPPLKQGRVLSPHVMAVMTKYWDDVTTDGKVIEDRSKLSDMDNEN